MSACRALWKIETVKGTIMHLPPPIFIFLVVATTIVSSTGSRASVHLFPIKSTLHKKSSFRHFSTGRDSFMPNDDAETKPPPRQQDQEVSTYCSSVAKKPSSSHTPCQYVREEEGRKKWRLCVASAVLNDQQQLLIGERIAAGGNDDTRNSCWQCPQGGVDVGESISQAAIRELYEEMGLIVNQHVVLLLDNNNDDNDTSAHVPARKYPSAGTNGWMERAGFAGQELHWRIFQCIDPPGMSDPEVMCDLSGQNGESAEFQRVKWANVEDVVNQVSKKKREPYQALRDFLRSNERFAADR